MVPVAALEVAGRALLVAVAVAQGGIDADHDQLTEVSVAGARRRDPPVAGLDQLPHPFTDLVARQHDPRQRRIVDLVQRSPHRRDRRHLPEHPALVAQHRGPGQVLRATGD